MPRILGIDHGTVRIGLALSDEMELVANPLKTLAASKHAVDEIVRLVREKQVVKIIIGMPLHMSGDKGTTALRVEKFGDQLGKALGHEVPLEYVDERLSSVTAERALKRSGQKIDPKSGIVDQIAAVVILQEYLNTQRGPEGFLLPETEMDMPWMDEEKGRRR
ncbi:MAG: ruvX [Verrucomicrobiaceae bacterium]|nr:ruvX [Verrucomicrobiaceae bacterium]